MCDANIREMPSTSSEVVGQYFKGKPLKVHSITDGWAKVGKYQYISVSLQGDGSWKNEYRQRKVRKIRILREFLCNHLQYSPDFADCL